MKNLLVTGGAGFIGTNFIYYVQRHYPHINILNLDALTYAGNPDNLSNLPNPDHYHFIQGDIRDAALIEKILLEYQIDTIVHFAAESHVDRSIADPAPFISTNVMGTCSLLEAARKTWKSNDKTGGVKFHHISTDEVFGSLSPNDRPFSEMTPYNPNSPYAASKAASDHFVRAYYRTYGLPVTISNCSNNYGPFQYPEKLIPLIIINALNGKPLPIYGDGKQIRDWLFVIDHCEAIMEILIHGQTGETYCIGGNTQITNLEMVEIICSLLDEKVPTPKYRPHKNLIHFVPDRPGHDRRYAINTNKIKNTLGWQPSKDIISGLSQTIDWYLEHQEWVSTTLHKNNYQMWIQYQYGFNQDGE